jgi:hypothetical protein
MGQREDKTHRTRLGDLMVVALANRSPHIALWNNSACFTAMN